MITLRKAEERGKASFGWLKSHHSFSFGSYYDPAHMGFSALRVINDDWVAPGAGFDTHGHRDMEIITLVLQGAIVHKDSAGNEKVLPAGEFQLMSAGSGVYHSEYNASQSEDLRFLQIWIMPDQQGGAPGYQQKHFAEKAGLTLIASADGRDGSLVLKQQAQLLRLSLSINEQLSYQIAGRNGYLQLISGELTVGDQIMQPGDGLVISAESVLLLHAAKPSEALLFDLP
ncbi:MAG: pirin family protein [Rheinheimera sp.]|uniref:pirin family protein n=1 Tax=Arsukibacterium sp. UBA3155 TaxID=1946058 RepID=UPI000C89E8FF|nr:pirin family protein [Arsukibacterium sp. UBA3155]MAD73302.1 pirin family protein [Rheinheimera sp.]|tara:strand:+ start:133615 stop:134301 length:687 start_codon:yes stop_codon:yes gene_type:complete